MSQICYATKCKNFSNGMSNRCLMVEDVKECHNKNWYYFEYDAK
jgi:hypothetical protein